MLFLQVGCGAIGCELLKNFALLGIARSQGGMVYSLLFFTILFRCPLITFYDSFLDRDVVYF